MVTQIESNSTQNILKTRYGQLEKAVPTFALFQQRIKYESRAATGDNYTIDVVLQLPHGHTYNAQTSTLTTGFALGDQAAGKSPQATVRNTEYMNRDFVSYGLISAAKNGNEASFASGLDLIVGNLNMSSRFALEELIAYGGRWIGEVSGATFSDPAPANSGANDLVIYVTKREWSAGIMSLRVGSYVDVYDTTGTYPNYTVTATKRNSGTCQITAVNTSGSNRQVTLTFSVAGDRAGVVETDVIVPAGTGTTAAPNWSLGIAQTAVTTAFGGTLYGIASSSYPLWQSSVYNNASAALTWTQITNLVANFAAKGGMGAYTVVTSPWSYNDINNNQAALRQYTTGYGGKFENGGSSLTYHGPSEGLLEIVPHPMVKAGEAFIMDFDKWLRIGSSEPTFELPGTGRWFCQQMPDNAAMQLRQWWAQAPMTFAPAALGYVYNITPSGLA